MAARSPLSPRPRDEAFTNFNSPRGIALAPAIGLRRVYIVASHRVLRYLYRTGEVSAAGPPNVITSDMPPSGTVSYDGQRLLPSAAGGIPMSPACLN